MVEVPALEPASSADEFALQVLRDCRRRLLLSANLQASKCRELRYYDASGNSSKNL